MNEPFFTLLLDCFSKKKKKWKNKFNYATPTLDKTKTTKSNHGKAIKRQKSDGLITACDCVMGYSRESQNHFHINKSLM